MPISVLRMVLRTIRMMPDRMTAFQLMPWVFITSSSCGCCAVAGRVGAGVKPILHARRRARNSRANRRALPLLSALYVVDDSAYGQGADGVEQSRLALGGLPMATEAAPIEDRLREVRDTIAKVVVRRQSQLGAQVMALQPDHRRERRGRSEGPVQQQLAAAAPQLIVALVEVIETEG